MESVGKIKIAFPDLEKEFYFILIERIKKSQFTDKRLVEAINYVIDNCIYPKPTIANFMSYNRLEKLLNHDEICKLAHPSIDVFKMHEKIKLNDNTYWYRKNI